MDKFLHILKKLIPHKLFKSLQPAYHFFWAWLGSLIYRSPSEKLIVIGVTGTTGKTTSTYLIAKMLERLGFKVGYTSTAMFSDGQREWLNDKKMTMPGRLFTQRMLARMAENGCQYAVVETTSEGVRQFRHRFLNYDALVFTGLYPEHIESHGSFENYKQAKAALFAHLKNCPTKYINEAKQVVKAGGGVKKLDYRRIKKTIIVNFDDEHAEDFLSFWAEKKIAFSRAGKKSAGDKNIELINYSQVTVSETGTSFRVRDQEIKLQLLGDFNATNAMTAVCFGLAQDLKLNKISSALAGINGVPGRLERVEAGQDFIVIVDYAFEPVALEKLYETVELIPHNKIIHLLGSAGGGRDVARRPVLGRIAGERADLVVVTNEDPYDENPDIIIDAVALGAEKSGKVLGRDLFKNPDRRQAVRQAVGLAMTGDIVLLTGKGSEQAICLSGGRKTSWDDRLAALEELKALVDKI